MNTEELIKILKEGKEIVEEYARREAILKNAISEFRQAFVIAVGDSSPFAKVALKKIDDTMEALNE